MPITHAFVSAIADDPDAVAAGEVVPSNWNASHTIETPLTVAATPNTSAIVMSGYEITGGNAQAAFSLTGEIDNDGTSVDVFSMSITNTSNNGGNAFRIRTDGNDAIKVDLAGDLSTSGWHAAGFNSNLPAGGNTTVAYYLGNGSGGNTGLIAGTGTPTQTMFGKPGSLYLRADGDAIPWYNTDGATAYDQLVGRTAAQAITNKTQLHLTPQTAPSSPASGWVIYVDTADGTLKAKNASGTVRSLAAP